MKYLGVLLLAIVVPIISFFMLKDGSLLREELIDLVAPGRNRELMEDVLGDIHLLLLQYMRALFTLCLAVFASFALVFALTGCNAAPPDTHDADVKAIKDNEVQWNADWADKFFAIAIGLYQGGSE